MFGKRKLKVINARLRVPSLGVRLPPSTALVGALYTVLGTTLGVPLEFNPSPGIEVRVNTSVSKDPRVLKTRSYLFIGDVAVFKGRAGTYEVVMPPSTASTDSITKALGRVLLNAVRWERILFFIAQFPSCGSIHSLFIKDNLKGLKRPWKAPNPVGMPPPDTLLGLGEGVRYGDVISVHDGVVDAGLMEEFPNYELGYVVYDDDIVTAVYVVNPARVNVAYRRVNEFGFKPLGDLVKELAGEEKKPKGSKLRKVVEGVVRRAKKER